MDDTIPFCMRNRDLGSCKKSFPTTRTLLQVSQSLHPMHYSTRSNRAHGNQIDNYEIQVSSEYFGTCVYRIVIHLKCYAQMS